MRFLTSFAGGQKTSNRFRRRNRWAKRRVLVEALEDRRLLAVFTVTTLADEPFAGAGATATTETADGAGLSLREAIGLANLNEGGAGQGETDGDSITFAGVLSDETIDLTLGQLSITDDLIIDGGAGIGDSRITIDAGDASRIFDVDTSAGEGTNSTVSLSELIVTNGNAPPEADRGGGINGLDSPITLTNVDITFSNALVGGGISVEGGSLTVTGGTISDNTGTSGGGITVLGNASLTITDSTIETNSAASDGGGIFINEGSVATVDGGTISDNTASGPSAGDGGGGIINFGGTLTIGNTAPVTISDNIADGAEGSGGGIFNGNGGALFVTNSLIIGNIANRAGGGIEDNGGSEITLSNVTLDNNIAGPTGTANPGNGGGLHVTGSGDVDIIGGTVSGNTAAQEGGGLWNSTGTMTIDGTTIDGNTASGPAADNGGGGIFNAGGTLQINGGDIDNNQALGDQVLSNVTLGGDQEVPAVTTDATGEATFVFDPATETFDLDLFVTGLELVDASPDPELTMAHIHAAAAGVNGSVIVNLLETESFVEDNGGLRLSLTGAAFPAANVADLFADGLYINVHSSANPGGEIRGQITAAKNSASGGGILNDGGTVNVTGTSITGNTANRAGGGIETIVGDVTLTNISLDTNLAGPTGSAAPGNGGGLHVTGAGDVSITDGAIGSNSAASEGGGLWNGTGTMTIDGTVISFNTASGDAADEGGGGIFNNGGTLSLLNGVSVDANVADGMSGSGGGILNNTGGTLTIDGSTVASNVANRAGGGIEDNSGAGFGTTLTGVILDNNTASGLGSGPGNGGGLHVTGGANVSITGGTINLNSAAEEGGGLWNDGGTMTIDGTTISGNTASGSATGGGGIHNDGGSLNLQSALVINNSADSANGAGGGIFNVDSGTLSITDSTISGNTADRGGGINNYLSDSTTVTNSTISGNTATFGGGGIYSTSPGATDLINSTISGNIANESGGGIYNRSGTVTAIHTTIVGNRSDTDGNVTGIGGGIFTQDIPAAVTNLFNAIVAGNVTGAEGADAPNDIAEKAIATGSASNLIGDPASAGGLAEGTAGNRIGDGSGTLLPLDQILDPALAGNGGPTLTHALVTDSRALDGGDNTFSTTPGDDGIPGTADTNETPILVDQRGFPFEREFGVNVDIGAFERQTLAASALIVTTMADEFDFVGDVSLREAINRAEGSVGADTITFDPSVTTSNLSDLGEITIGDSDAITIQGNGANQTTIDGNGYSRIFNLTGDGAVTFDGVTLTGGNTSGTGGAINASSSGSLTILRSTITGNSSSSTGSEPTGDNNNGGGGIFTGDRSLVVIDSTISGNSSAADGGGINSPYDYDVTLINSTVSGNMSGGRGGGLYFDDGDIRIINSTITSNTATGAGGGIGNLDDGNGETLTIHNSIIAGNTDDGSAPDFVAPGFPATDLEVFSSLIGDNAGTTLTESQTPNVTRGNIIGSLAGAGIINPMLDLLGDNGGPTRTHALLAGSPAIDTGRDPLAVGLGPDGLSGTSDDVAFDGDQRGAPFDRIDGTMVDMGAYELQVFDANSLIVNISFDQLDFDQTQISLREAILAAADNPGDDTVSFDPLVTSSDLSDLGEIKIGGSDAITIQGNGADQTTIDGDGYSRIFHLTGDGDVTFEGVTLTGGVTSGNGGAINASGSGSLTILRSTITGNSSSSPTSNNDNGGGGIFTGDRSLVVIDSTISGNSSAADGGGINSPFSADVTLTNSTVSGNTSGRRGGGLYFDDGAARIINSTITSNTATGAGGGIGNLDDGAGETLTIHNSIIAGNTDDGSAPDFLAPADPETNLEVLSSLIGDNTGTTLAESQTQDPETGNFVGDSVNPINPVLDPLTNNGGPTQTHALLAGSPAIDAGNNTLVPTGDFDQRGTGFPRVVDGDVSGTATVDMGAFEAVSSVNQQPTFTASSPPTVMEDSGLQTVSGFATFDAGDPSESSQTVLAYTVSDITNAALFFTPPAIDMAGNLTYTLADNAFGTSDFSVVVQDSGGTAGGGVDTSDPQVFTVTVTGVNDAPTFTATNPPPVVQDAGAQTVNAFASFNAGPNESAQSVMAYSVTGVTNGALFSEQPAIDNSGNLTYTPAAGAVGMSDFTVAVQDDGGTTDGGVDTSAPQTFTITVSGTPNAQPTFTASNPPTVAQDSGAQDVTGFATFDPGAASEADQMVLAYTVSAISNAALFSVDPSIDTSGNLTYTPAAGAFGTSTFMVTVQDDGGTAGGGVDTSAPQTFTITVTEDMGDVGILDVTGSGNSNPFQDGIIIVRFMLGQPDANLEDPLLIPDDATRTAGAELRAFLVAAGDALDANGDGELNPFQDGVLIVRFLLGQPPANLEDPALIPAGSTRTTGAEISAYLETLLPPASDGEFVPRASAGGEGETVAVALVSPADVNRDRSVTTRDALDVINEIDRGGGGEQFDVNQDGRITAKDALQVINRLAEDVVAANAGLVDAQDDEFNAVDELLSDNAFLKELY